MRLFEDYRIWCDEGEVKERDRLSRSQFAQRLSGFGMGKGKKTINGKQLHVRMGIRLVSDKLPADS
jgi:hypothetical protein